MEIDLGSEAAEFRAEIRTWIEQHAPAGLADLADWNETVITGGHSRSGSPERSELYAAWEKELLAARLICPQWPEEFGGRGFTPVQNAVWTEELYRARLPRIRRGFGEAMVGPSVMAWGTREQQEHFLPRIVSGEDAYCQGFSEPDHGSDLGSVSTRGEVVGDEVAITGSKVWTSGFSRANMMFVLCRTDADAPKHRGLSYVLVPMKDNNIEASPLRQMTGAAQFGQEFFDGAIAPLFNVIGGLGNGWKVAMTTLGFERGGSASTAHLRFEREFFDLVDLARRVGRTDDPVIRDQLAWAYSQVQLMRYQGLRTLALLADGREPGPEASASKLFWSEYEKRLGEIAMDLWGSAALVRPKSDDRDDYRLHQWQEIFLASRAGTIYSGTSEVQRNIIAERALGMPREAKPRRGVGVSRLEGRVAVVTGAGRGIGAAVARTLAAQGARVLAVDLGVGLDGSGSDAGPLAGVVEEITAAGGIALADHGDVGDHAVGEGLIERARSEFGGVDIVVNAAGILRDRMIFNMTQEEWDAVIRVHLKGHFNLIRPASAHWRERNDPDGAFRIINFTSASGLYGAPGQPNYAAAKMGIVGLTYSLANSLGRLGVTANAVSPVAATRMTASIPGERKTSPSRPESERDAANIAPLVGYLASRESSWLTGRVVGANGYDITLYSNPEPQRVLAGSTPWDIDALGRQMERTFQPAVRNRTR